MKINLIPEEKSTEIKEQRSNFTATAIAIVIAATVIGLTVLLLSVNKLKSKQIDDDKRSIDRIKKELKDYAEVEKTLITVESGIEDIKKLNDSSFKWNRVLMEIEKTLPDDVVIKSYENNEGKISMRATAISVETMNKLLESLMNHKVAKAGDDSISPQALFKDVKCTGYTKISDNQIDFDVSFQVEGGILWN
ncbi:TPA: hypothetical protein DDW69_04600 [candidate division CPR2 bacterium]|uniref:Fimbrial assembly family protein n=1 Tax=candidate division CPR2 bacterium GW2011_GWC1_41_48 TaxID=1618344 RepID=A0A0G0W8K6_UNCC2|nr:MAG: hypothetical protein UT47_C0002G0202 [candidate division CPR2 bacterium GW2011_GWC2_39_35]KKR29059.1 MAG: hypothetical protein UT60_C0007G0004 [candidate division CPR2 bacterium GW2011_GWD2_39_7]KKS09324.1 MAG: hypothetical protein UU65_C0002G0102 [candidate division CPR2 bacterium GW2011_GWC1_41_48]OGB70547.1 MAG: hypothetical protein A2Y26_04370 [candidate division CPR2 bacterium GWD2_39_7]HBG82080.1 hypothetical protein [candidate division CPR2 bacterium]